MNLLQMLQQAFGQNPLQNPITQMIQQAIAPQNAAFGRQNNNGVMGQSLWAANGGRPPWGGRLPGAPSTPAAPQSNAVPTGAAPAPAGTDLLSLLRQAFAPQPGATSSAAQPPAPMRTQGPGTGMAPPAQAQPAP